MPHIGGGSNSGGFGSESLLSNAGFGAALNNNFTGNLDFQRQNFLFDRQVAANNATAAADRAFASEQNELTRAFNAAEAQKARDFAQKQSETQYLRAAEQLKQLGINPAVLAFGGSAGSAAAMSGSSASSGSSSAGSHHVSGVSWSRSASNGFSDLLRLTGSMANSASIVFRALSFLR